MSPNHEGYVRETFALQRLNSEEEVVSSFDLKLVNGDCYLGDAGKFVGEGEVVALDILSFVEGD